MFKFILLNFFRFFCPLPPRNNHLFTSFHPLEFSETIQQDKNNDLLVSHYDCGEHLDERRFSFYRVDDCSANPHDVANNKARVDVYIRAKATTIAGYQCPLLYTKDTKGCGYNANLKHYPDRRSSYQNTMLRYQAVSHKGCENHNRYLSDLHNKYLNRTVEHPKSIAFLTDSDQDESISKNQSKRQATAFDQGIYGVWVSNPQNNYKTWIPEAS